MNDETKEDTSRLAYEQRRFKILSIKSQWLVDLLNWARNPNAVSFPLPLTDELPEDCRVVTVSASWERQCVEALVCSSEFEPCPDGWEIQRIPKLVTEFRQVKVIADDE